MITCDSLTNDVPLAKQIAKLEMSSHNYKIKRTDTHTQRLRNHAIASVSISFILYRHAKKTYRTHTVSIVWLNTQGIVSYIFIDALQNEQNQINIFYKIYRIFCSFLSHFSLFDPLIDFRLFLFLFSSSITIDKHTHHTYIHEYFCFVLFCLIWDVFQDTIWMTETERDCKWNACV